jgi:hypothetical protein
METMQFINHVFWRFWMHIFGTAGPILAISLILLTVKRHYKTRFLPQGVLAMLTLAGFVTASVWVLREPFDVASGGRLVKTVFDFISVFAGAGVSIWGLYRFRVWQE